MQPFTKQNINSLIEERYKKIDKDLAQMNDDTIISNDIEVIVENIFEKYKFELVSIEGEIQDRKRFNRIKIGSNSVRSSVRHVGFDGYELDGYILTKTFRYSGDMTIFDCESDTRLLSSYPDINLFENMFEISAVDTEARVEQESNVLDNSIDRQLKIITDFVGHVNTSAQKYNDSLKKRIKLLLEKRIQTISKFRKLAEKYNVPIHPSDPEVLKVVKVERKIFPLAKERSAEKEYCLADDSYHDILRIIKHHCSTFERTPKVYSVHKEEELRDILLAALNCVFEGAATGETFRKGGKADITIEVENRSAFIAECKIWDGVKIFEEAIEQLFRYITWRDTKLCLVIFSKRKDFFDVVKTINEYLQKSPSKIALRSLDKNEIEYQCVSSKNDGQILKIRILVIDLYIE